MPPLGRNFFRSSPGNQASNASSSDKVTFPTGDEKIKPLISQEDLELEYLNEISRLTREKEEARDEIDKCVRDSELLNSSLRESNESLLVKVSELEAKVGSQLPKTTTDYDNKQLQELRAKLSKYHDTNKVLSAKVQRLKQRRLDGDDFSDVSSVGSLSLMSTHASVFSAQGSGQNDIIELQNKYENELARNNELQQKIRVVEANKDNAEKLLEELRIQSTERTERRDSDMAKLQRDLALAEESIAKLESATGDDRDEVEGLRSTPLHEELDSYKIKIAKLEKEISASKEEIIKLNSVIEDSTGKMEKMLELKETVKRLEEEKVKNLIEIDTLKKEKQNISSQLESLERALKESKESSEKAQKELDCLRDSNTNTPSSSHNEIICKDEGGQDELLKTKENQISELNNKIEILSKDKEDAVAELENIESILAMTKLKNAQLMEQVELLESDNKKEKEEHTTSSKEKNLKKKIEEQKQLNKKKISDLETKVKEKEVEIEALKADSLRLTTMVKRVDDLEKDIEQKSNELVNLKTEKSQSAQRLETLEMDFMVTQQKGAKTWEELEDLKEKLEHEQLEKASLQTQLKRMDSVDKLIDDTKRLSEAALKERDSEIEKLKRQLTEANIAKGATERKLINVMNDTVAQESSRELMKQELEEQLLEENEKAKQLESLIRVKEEDIEKVRQEFNNLAKNMQNENEKKRSQVAELNGEILEKTNLLNEKDRDLQFLKGEIDDIELRHKSEVNRLREELSSSVDKVELEKLRTRNSELEYNILSLNQEIGKLRAMLVNQPSVDVIVEDAPVKVLRARNEQLKKEVENLTLKLRQSRHRKDSIKRIDSSSGTMIASNRKQSSRKSSRKLSRRDSGREEI